MAYIDTPDGWGFTQAIESRGDVAIPLDGDNGWTGYIDDFFVFMAGYTFFMGNRQKSLPNKRMLYTISGAFFIAGMLSLIALILFGE